MKKTRKVKSIIINGRRWFDRKYGNTYNSAEVYINGEFAVKLGASYGYDQMYEQRSWEWIEENYHLNHNSCPSLFCRENNIKYSCSASDVSRMRDL